MTNTLESYSSHLDTQYHIRTILPTLKSQNTIDAIREIEKNNIPKNTNEFLEVWTSLI